MKAVVQDSYGSADVLHITEIPTPEIKANEVLVKVHAAGVDRGTWHLMTGRPYLMRPATGLRHPKNRVPGRDVAGTVSAVGSSTTRFHVGDEVFGVSGGSFAEYAAAREDKLAHKPSKLSFEQAAVVPISGLTALKGLRDVGRIQAGQDVLIIGASGGVGSYAVQLAKALGAHVTGVCSTGKVDFVRSLGADEVLDYTRQDFADGAKRYDLILDVGGSSSVARLRRALTPAGALVIVGGEGETWTGMNRQLRVLVLSPFVRQRLTTFINDERASGLEVLAPLIEAGKITPIVDRTFPLEEAAEAIRYLEAGKARGKIAISI